ncbi:tyrosine-protein kinase, non-receptor Jak2, partial [Tanacetum coccineum]
MRIIIVYEYVRSGNLADKMSKHLNTIQRLEICLDAARGLEYLHTGVDESKPGIVHGHIKLSKILLNSEPKSSRFKAKVSGFGFSRLLPGDVQIAPRSMDGELMKESDVYTFGTGIVTGIGPTRGLEPDSLNSRMLKRTNARAQKKLQLIEAQEETTYHLENEIDKDSIDVPTPEESKNDADSSSSKLLHSFHRPVLNSKDGQEVAEITDTDDAKQEKDNQDDTESKEEITESKISPMEITTDQQVQNDGKHGVLLKPGAEPELSVNTRGDLNDFSTDETLIPVEKPKVSEITRSNSACSESSNGDGTTPTDYLLPKSPTNETTKETAVAVPGCVSSVTELFFTEGNFGINWYHALPGSEVDALVKRIK